MMIYATDMTRRACLGSDGHLRVGVEQEQQEFGKNSFSFGDIAPLVACI